jgi:ABC-2 type transport system permease protein
VASFFSDLSIHSYGITFLVFVLTSVLFSLAGFINGVFANSFDDISIIPTFVLTPLTYLGGVFYSMSLLPEFWQTVSMANPVLYMVNAFRYGLLGVSDINLNSGIAIILGFTFVLAVYAHSLMRRGVGIKS